MTNAAGPLAEVTRRDELSGTGHIESHHVGHVVVTVAGRVMVAYGDPERATFLRSSIKPIQATACLELLEDAGWPGGEPTPAEVAVGWASHRAQDEHLAAVAQLCARAGIDPDELTCPPDLRPDGQGQAPLASRRIHHNCSGKHALFALAGRVLGLHGPALLERQGQLQVLLLHELRESLGGITAVAVDGCGAPAVEGRLCDLATAFGGLATDDRHARVRAAGLAHPGMVGGRGRLESALLGAGTMAKLGAEGVYGAGWSTDAGPVGVAVKAEDGATRAAAAGLAAVVEIAGRSLGGWGPEASLGGGEQVGTVLPSRQLLEALAPLADLP